MAPAKKTPSMPAEVPTIGEQLEALAQTALEHIPVQSSGSNRPPEMNDLTLGVMTAAVVGGLLEEVCARGVPLATDALVTCERLTRALLGLNATFPKLGDAEEVGALQVLASDASLRLHIGLHAAYELWTREAA